MTYRVRHPEQSQEEDRLPTRQLLTVLAVTGVIGAALLVLAWTTVGARTRLLRPSGEFDERNLPARTSIEGLELSTFEEDRARRTPADLARAELSTFGWVDRERGLVRVPIEDAMDWVAEEPR